MDFSNRDIQTPSAAPATHVAPVGEPNGKRRRSSEKRMWGRFGVVAATLAVVALLVGLIVFVATGNNIKSEDKYVYTNKLQAVFLNTGQVYFGNITELNTRYVVLTNIYYLQTSNSSGTSATTTSSANTSVSLVKLGCELHQPYDQMVINRTQVTFWENLEDTGQVAKAVATFQKENPNGQKCSDQSSSSSSTAGSSVQGAGTKQ